ncbi:MAG: hypothetical protein COW00_00865 [Bdellovibrio sp. CG12_big_fil_rev_8_21_14_0_65_39_13]|nr:MAG: hypothetical protein COW78_20455 [Bdellovibrio sp. CG22_combo_CG10-13_8_21_14_all_39_27]PIQ62806.1 MAG: hypothetical protein COW00_00865 [Bdellovibrio sp. CG12_big_fil_rev_8_21_14_0_65_39_13]PIR32536.1 MAG: hypothetical protein COV37_19550 [Bdellovibrio sp. CG11_big_fil_rev_8_21_14_0_20_39_38]
MQANEKVSILFNFSSSYVGGGFKRLKAYLNWYNENHLQYKSIFIINKRIAYLELQFPNVTIYTVNPSKFARFFCDDYYLNRILKNHNAIDVYFAYGFPVYRRLAKLNWFHLSNLLPLKTELTCKTSFERLKMKLLAHRIKRSLPKIDIFSAESPSSIKISIDSWADTTIPEKYCLENGIDEYLMESDTDPCLKAQYAISIGTKYYKRIDKVIEIFKVLNSSYSELEFKIIGPSLGQNKFNRYGLDIEFIDNLPQLAVYSILRQTKFFVSASSVENSPNSLLEAILLAEKCIISDIPAHRDLLKRLGVDKINKLKIGNEFFLEIQKVNVSLLKNSLSWDHIIKKKMNYISSILKTSSNHV